MWVTYGLYVDIHLRSEQRNLALVQGTCIMIIVIVIMDPKGLGFSDPNPWVSGLGLRTRTPKLFRTSLLPNDPKENQYRIVNQLSNRALYAKKPPDSNWEPCPEISPSCLTDHFPLIFNNPCYLKIDSPAACLCVAHSCDRCSTGGVDVGRR